MELTDWLNFSGLLCNIAGALMMFFATPKVDFGTWVFMREEEPKMRRKALRRNLVIRSGALLLFAGFLCQLIGFLLV